MEELVFAIQTDRLWKILSYMETGLIKGSPDVLDRIAGMGLFRKRSELEEDPSYKQLISYAIISNKGSFFLFRREAGQREKRLHNKLHLGVGGHMNPLRSDEKNAEYLSHELKREFFEEVKLLNDTIIEDIEFIGFINDDSIPVGRVHIGLLYNIHLSGKDLVIKETDKMTAGWIEKADLAKYYHEMETWTKIAVDSYIRCT